MKITIRNIFTGASAPPGFEESLTLFENAQVRVERIVSNAHSSPAGFWYDQPEDEWVMVLRGQARLEFAGGESVAMRAGIARVRSRGGRPWRAYRRERKR